MGETIAILHHNDMDGLVAAWVASKYLDKNGASISRFPVQYNVPLPVEFTDKSWSAIYILDFSPSLEVFDELLARDGKLVMLDHHKTAMKEYAAKWMVDGGFAGGEPYIWSPDEETKVIFHDGVAGCEMTEYYFQDGYADGPFKQIKLPALVQYAADHDLWKFELAHSKEIRTAFQTYDMTLCSCDSLNAELESALGHLVEEGRAIQRYKDKVIATALNYSEWLEIDGRRGLAAEMPVAGLISEVAGKLAEQEGADFGCCWFKVAGSNDWVYSLRSRGDFDVGRLAKHHGGGGHEHAAGFATEDNPFSFLTGEKFEDKS